jgi:hypothetical protein|tara:strand:+ start:764 stop:1129 length:366 start_codon:yes stop_codon:yes gene_type:complete
MPSPLFKAKFRIVENTKAEKDNDPTHKMPMEFTPDDARAAAQYLIDMANKAEDERTTIRKYTGQNEFSEVTGFTCWLSMWDQSGSWAPMPPMTDSTKRENTQRRKAFAKVDDLEDNENIPF